MKRETDDGYRRTNREMRMEPRGSGFCWGCDRALVPDGSVCPICGQRRERIRNKPRKPVVRD